ncbi:MAG: hypothetical protein DRO23_02350 [Thermoprotei archaeon]|nr:MAG: hypothetical protein DRO23_02350 [Thermoprotei archaeon]
MPMLTISRGIYVIGGPEISYTYDAYSYMVKIGNEYVIIDAGTGLGFANMLSNILELGIDIRRNIRYVILTHCHVDHAGGAYMFYKLGLPIVMHEADAEAVRTGNTSRTASDMLNISFIPSPVTISLRKDKELNVNGSSITIMHTPGHTPGSISIYFQVFGKNIVAIGDLLGVLRKEWFSNGEEWRKSIEKILALDFDIVLSGHFYERKNPKEIFYSALEHGPTWIN